ncbi:MAG TPA: AbrB/MazE/SpoVT family DNA-binding domain-containing protein [Firmicutes bacterium]|nr:AbrB/MazE/SpoVT family DNA-binding domain-containing protein [Bacillota bacterium]
MARGNTALMERVNLQKKRISVSPKRQITIPLQFYNKLGIDSEVECFVKDGALVIKPVHEIDQTFAAEILDDLVEQGFQGKELVAKFKEATGRFRKAVEKMIEEADELAKITDDGSSKVAEIFGRED